MHSRDALCHDVHVRLGLYQRNTRPQSPRNEDRMMFVVDLIALERERHGKIVNAAIGSPRRKHPHDGVEFTIESNLPPYNATVGGKPSHPQLVGQDDDVILAYFALFRQEVTAQERTLTYYKIR